MHLTRHTHVKARCPRIDHLAPARLAFVIALTDRCVLAELVLGQPGLDAPVFGEIDSKTRSGPESFHRPDELPHAKRIESAEELDQRLDVSRRHEFDGRTKVGPLPVCPPPEALRRERAAQHIEEWSRQASVLRSPNLSSLVLLPSLGAWLQGVHTGAL